MLTLSTVALLSLVPITICWRRFRTIFNPVSLFCASYAATIGFAYLIDYLAQTQELHGGFRSDPDAAAPLYGLGLMSFLLPWLPLPCRKVRQDLMAIQGVKDMGHLKEWTYACSILILLLLALCMWGLGSIPLVSMVLGHYSIAEHIENLKRLPMGLMALVLLATFLLILHSASMIVHRHAYRLKAMDFFWFALVLLLSVTWQGNRQGFLIIIFFVVARWALAAADGPRPPLLRVVKRALVGCAVVFCFVAFFVGVGKVRYANLGGGVPLELLMYFSWPVYNVISIQDSGHFGGDWEPHYVLTEILPSRFGGKAQVIEMGQYLFEPTSPSGYFSYWFLDYGYAGVMAGSLALSVFCRWAYGRQRRSETEMRIYLLVLWCCATAGIYNHFLSLHFFWLPLTIMLLERWFARRHFYPKPFPSAPAGRGGLATRGLVGAQSS